AVGGQLVDQPRQPFLVVRHAEIFGRRQELELMTGVVQVLSAAAGSQHARDGIGPRFPGRVKHRLVLLVLDGTHAVHAAHVVDAVHAFPPATETLPTPTIESRVTILASCSSVMCSLPAGRSGRTR